MKIRIINNDTNEQRIFPSRWDAVHELYKFWSPNEPNALAEADAAHKTCSLIRLLAKLSPAQPSDINITDGYTLQALHTITTKIQHKRATEEYAVYIYYDGELQREATYFTPDRDDAHQTAAKIQSFNIPLSA